MNCYKCGIEIEATDTVLSVEVKPKPSAVARTVYVHQVCPSEPAVEPIDPTDDPEYSDDPDGDPDAPEGYVESERVWGYPDDHD